MVAYGLHLTLVSEAGGNSATNDTGKGPYLAVVSLRDQCTLEHSLWSKGCAFGTLCPVLAGDPL